MSEISTESPRILGIRTARVTRKFKPELAVRGAKVTHDISTYLVVELSVEGGITGIGEVSGTKNWSGEDAESADELIRKTFFPYLKGKRLENIPEISGAMNALVSHNYFTKAGVNMALWDARGKFEHKPVYELLGGMRRSSIPVKISLSGDGEEITAGAEKASSLGFSSFKVKVGHGYERDISRFSLARSVVGDETFLGADANCGWEMEEAKRCIPELIARHVAFIEQPVARDRLDQLAELRALDIPVVADESVFDYEDAQECISQGAADAISIYIGKSGGLDQAMRIGELCASNSVDVIIGSNAELGVGTAAQIHVAASLTRLGNIPSDIIGHHFYTDDILASPNKIDGKYAYVPDAPGLGVELREDVVSSLR